MPEFTPRVVNFPEDIDSRLRKLSTMLNCNKSDFIRGAVFMALCRVEHQAFGYNHFLVDEILKAGTIPPFRKVG